MFSFGWKFFVGASALCALAGPALDRQPLIDFAQHGRSEDLRAHVPAAAQSECQPTWNLDLRPGSWVLAMTVFDDGSRPALYAGGLFRSVSVDGEEPAPANYIAKWDSEQWHALGEGMNSWVRALAVFDDGSGPALYAGGHFTSAGGTDAAFIARWDFASETWSAVGDGLDGFVNSLAVFDDGSSQALYAGGSFTAAGGIPATGIARWNGSAWAAVGGGIDRGAVYAMAVFNDGSGDGLYVGGAFRKAGDAIVHNIARWDGKEWSPLGDGTTGTVRSLHVFDGALLMGGAFHQPIVPGHSPHIARWHGPKQGWSGFPQIGAVQIVGEVRAIIDFNDGFGTALYAGGRWQDTATSQIYVVAKWTDDGWIGFHGQSPASTIQVPGPRISDLAVFAAPGEPAALHVGRFAGGIGDEPPALGLPRLQACSLPGDLNGDGVVDLNDLLMLLKAWGECPPGDCPADLNGDGVVDVLDLLILLEYWT
jgi:hypothetical protein